MHRNRKLDRSERSTRVTTDARAGLDYELADLVGDLLQVFDL